MASPTIETPIPPLEKISRRADGADVVKRETARILVAGAGGMIGSAVAPSLAKQGYAVVRLVRRAPGEGEVRWDPDGEPLTAESWRISRA